MAIVGHTGIGIESIKSPINKYNIDFDKFAHIHSALYQHVKPIIISIIIIGRYMNGHPVWNNFYSDHFF